MPFWFALSCVPPIEVVGKESVPVDTHEEDSVVPVDSDVPLAAVSVSPVQLSGAGGDLVVISGTGFAEGVSVTIGGTAATVGAVTSDSVGVIAPPGVEGPADVVVTLGDESSTLTGAVTYMKDFASTRVMSIWGWIRENPPEGFLEQLWMGYFDSAWEAGPTYDADYDGEPDTTMGPAVADTCVYFYSVGRREDFKVPYLDIGAPGAEQFRLARDKSSWLYMERESRSPGRIGEPLVLSWLSGVVPAADQLQVGVFPVKGPTVIKPAADDVYVLGTPLQLEWEPMGGGPLEVMISLARTSTSHGRALYCVVTDDGAFEVPMELHKTIEFYVDYPTFGEPSILVEVAASNWTEVEQPVSRAIVQTHLAVATSFVITSERQ